MRARRQGRVWLFAIGLWLGAPTVLAQSGGVTVNDAWLRESVPGQTTAAGYLTVRNGTASDVVLARVTVTGVPRVEMHEHRHENGMMRMRPVSQLRIPAGEHVRFQPGGYHLMLFALPAPLSAGDTRAVTLHFTDGTRVSVEAPVRAPFRD